MKDMELKNVVTQLRKEGLTYKEIADQLESPISKSTISGWCKGVILSHEQNLRIRNIVLHKLTNARGKALQKNRENRINYLQQIQQQYNGIEKCLVTTDNHAKTALALLYLAEGSKNSGGHIVFGNSDPGIISLFLKLLRESFQIDEQKFRCTVQCRADQNKSELESYWHKLTKVPKKQFYATRIDARTVGKKSIKDHYKGVCRIDYFSAQIYNELRVIGNILTK